MLQEQTVFCGANEWGSDVMRQIADDVAKTMPQAKKLVTVHEHAGWWLTWYYRAGKDTICVFSANDQAVFHGEAAAARKEIRQLGFSTTHLPVIQRQ